VIPDYSIAPDRVEFLSGRGKTIPLHVPLRFDRPACRALSLSKKASARGIQALI